MPPEDLVPSPRYPALVAVLVSGPVLVAMSATPPSRAKEIYDRVTHLAWVVDDVVAVSEAWSALGVRDITTPAPEAFDVTLAAGRRHVRVKKSTAYIGGVRIDWVQPLDAGGPYKAFLDAHGPGIHHVGYQVPDEAALERETAALSAVAAGAVRTGHRKCACAPTRFAWVEGEGLGGVAVDVEVKVAPRIPPPAPGGNEEPFNRISQYAFVVKDAAAVSRRLQELGFAPLAIEPNVSLDRVFRGSPGTFEMLLGWGRDGTVPFEWIQPTKGPSVYQEFLDAHGEGFHHLGFEVPDMDAALARLKARGLSVTQSGGWSTTESVGRFAYLDADRFGGVAIELLGAR
jgi:catechol 2,3-dioxygenase-like lactoylglutathione lyase family enzyme